MKSATAASYPTADGTLAKALLRAAARLGLSQRAMARVLGISGASVSRMARGRGIDPGSKEGELALLFLRAYRSLDTLVGGGEMDARRWMHAENSALGGVPAELVQTVRGLVDVGEYLDAMRGTL